MTAPNRWIIALAGLVIEIVFGAIYAWSVFSIPLSTGFGWTIPQVTLTFEIAILVLGFVAFLGGFWLKDIDPRVIALTAGFLFGAGFYLASFAAHGLWVLYVSVGLISGTGLGIGYVVPIAVLVKWFPDRRALITGIVVCGFGAGALVTAPVATRLIEAVGVLSTFADLGIAFLLVTIGCGLLMRAPPPDWKPVNWRPNPRQASEAAVGEFELRGALKTWQWWALTAILFLNVALGVSLISEEDPIFQTLGHASPEVAGSLVGIAALGNAFGRVFWAWVSDFLTRRVTFAAIFAIQAILFALFSNLHGAVELATVAFLILACFGGSVGTMPSFVADCFGSHNVGAIYGAMLTAWGLGTVFGSSLLADIHQRSGSYEAALYILAGVALVSAVLPLTVRPPARQRLGKPTHTVFQVSTSGALVAGVYDREVSVATLLDHGDFGLGTFANLDGEMVIVDGRVYQVPGSGRVSEAAHDAGAPFAVVTWFKPDIDVSVASVSSFSDLAERCDTFRRSGNIFYALRLDGHFKQVRTRAVNPPRPGAGLAEAAKSQSEFEFAGIDGTLVGVWSPGFSSAFSVAGYHFHFLSADRQHGGHLLDIQAETLRLKVKALTCFHLSLPESAAFLRADLSKSTAGELAYAEQAH